MQYFSLNYTAHLLYCTVITFTALHSIALQSTINFISELQCIALHFGAMQGKVCVWMCFSALPCVALAACTLYIVLHMNASRSIKIESTADSNEMYFWVLVFRKHFIYFWPCHLEFLSWKENQTTDKFRNLKHIHKTH